MGAVCFGDALPAGDKITVCNLDSRQVPGFWRRARRLFHVMTDTDSD